MMTNREKKLSEKEKKDSVEASAVDEEESITEDKQDFDEDIADQSTTESIQEKLDESNDRLLRMAAEMENLRKRSLREKEDAIKYSITKFSRDIITVADDLERALESTTNIETLNIEDTKNLIEGIEITMKSLKQIFTRNGIERFDPLGEKFDPTQHEAMFEVPDDEKESGIVAHIVEPGYKISDRVLRPARVGVSKSNTKKNG
ncbi:MAG: nucleotide exchange factor GrpE [Alphaproteobacteria bacterium]|uniref:Protein GrpE n=1 Tax=PS1 clade bacterium TaxID=2175152 RepID=A0A368DSL8_9PROT|nr:nucleotide exchange factor GrpE [Rhodobiaceae bacterium]OUT74973.1 MAG: nucleotide exchange factor GrpE [Rhizobiales bacterium TMED25]RCL74326.1 MAG: nucleotide exchange factor GrpE [PS1 clade bacterium]|tara:strand:- start:15855 stop:16466 length:612 start_codon:yes stop_codon:yes gene_type:complete